MTTNPDVKEEKLTRQGSCAHKTPLLDVVAQSASDPCVHGNYKNLTDIHRSVAYKAVYPEPLLCDDGLTAGWYRAGQLYPRLTDPPIFDGPVIEHNAFYFTCDLTLGGSNPNQAFEVLIAGEKLSQYDVSGRFCGPATTVTVPCTCPPRVSVKTLGEAVWWTGECYTAVITLFPEQVHLLHTAPPTLFVTGPPGTGKTVVLLLMAIEWLRCGHHVYVVSSCSESLAACTMLYQLLLQTVKTQQSAGVSPGQPHLLQYDLDGGDDVEKAFNDLSQAASGGSLYVIADEATLCELLLTRVPRLHLWAASCYIENAPVGWQVEYLTRPLRSPPAVVREVEQDMKITTYRHVLPYSQRGVPDHTDGPPVTRLYHRGQGHSGQRPVNCVTCGREVGSFLHSLRVGVTGRSTTTSTTLTSTSGGTTPPCLQWRDVLVLYWGKVSDQSGMVRGLQEASIPVRVMKDDDIEDVATARSDVVWVVCGIHVRGLEKKVVVCLANADYGYFTSPRLDFMSRCTSQLVIVSNSR
ncbi:hypothetical protein C0Q70_20802 [Pomacea canaliculata]|uniref:Uncharacterized protein n=1 Tax=Pomacea canaliculata TaxID=400727 RepID=A0A2T7NAQ4_POMCA|nr:hypothetical protein C0Q70_20802 [Pomacea canaliculata]